MQDPSVRLAYREFIESIPSTYIKDESDEVEEPDTYIYQNSSSKWIYTPTLMIVNFDAITVMTKNDSNHECKKDEKENNNDNNKQEEVQNRQNQESKPQVKECIIQVQDSLKYKPKVTLKLFKQECNKLLKLGLNDNQLNKQMHCLISLKRIATPLNDEIISGLLKREPGSIEDVIPSKTHQRYSLDSWIFITTQTTFEQLRVKVSNYHCRHGIWFNIPSPNEINSQKIQNNKIDYSEYFEYDCRTSLERFKRDLINHIERLAN